MASDSNLFSHQIRDNFLCFFELFQSFFEICFEHIPFNFRNAHSLKRGVATAFHIHLSICCLLNYIT